LPVFDSDARPAGRAAHQPAPGAEAQPHFLYVLTHKDLHLGLRVVARFSADQAAPDVRAAARAGAWFSLEAQAKQCWRRSASC
jgi:hypothetical protein